MSWINQGLRILFWDAPDSGVYFRMACDKSKFSLCSFSSLRFLVRVKIPVMGWLALRRPSANWTSVVIQRVDAMKIVQRISTLSVEPTAGPTSMSVPCGRNLVARVKILVLFIEENAVQVIN